MGRVSHINACTPVGCPTIQLNSDTSTWRKGQTPQVKGSRPATLPPLQMPMPNPGGHLCFWATTYKWKFPTTSFWDSINLLEWFTEFRKPVYSLEYWFVTKDTKRYTFTARWRGPKQRSFCPCGVWGLASCHVEVILLPNLEALWIPSFWVFREASLFKHGWWTHWPLMIDSTSSPSPLPGNQGAGTSSQLTLPPPRALKSILYEVCVFFPALPLGSSEPFFFF